MTYSKDSKIQYTDYNSIVGTSTTSTAGQLNALWAQGNGTTGYGQTAVGQVNQNATVGYTEWLSIVSTTQKIANHQGTVITAIDSAKVPASGVRIDYLSAIPSNITTCDSNKLNATKQGTTSTTNATSSSTWSNSLTFTHTVTFASADQARYFFNCGGQLALTFSSPTGTGINALMHDLGVACGTIVMSAQSSGSITIDGTSYDGITKVGGSGTATTLSTNTGYYALGTSDTEIFKQLGSGTPAGYVNSYITVNAKSNGTKGSNGDNGTILTFTTLWDEVPNGLTVATGTEVALTVRYPRSTADTPAGYLTKSWGDVTVEGSVTGS